jgi:hypothetical protein
MENQRHMAQPITFATLHGVFGVVAVSFLAIYFITQTWYWLLPYGLFALLCAIGNFYIGTYQKKWIGFIWIANALMSVALLYKCFGAV